MTRAKKCVCLVGLPEMFQFMVENEMEQKRYSGLKDRILEIGAVNLMQIGSGADQSAGSEPRSLSPGPMDPGLDK